MCLYRPIIFVTDGVPYMRTMCAWVKGEVGQALKLRQGSLNHVLKISTKPSRLASVMFYDNNFVIVNVPAGAVYKNVQLTRIIIIIIIIIIMIIILILKTIITIQIMNIVHVPPFFWLKHDEF